MRGFREVCVGLVNDRMRCGIFVYKGCCGYPSPRLICMCLTDRLVHSFGVFVGGGAWGMPNGPEVGACIDDVPYGREP